jgi:hypothetical protein
LDSIDYYLNIPLDSIAEDIRQLNLQRLRAMLPPPDSTDVDANDPIEGETPPARDAEEGRRDGRISNSQSKESERIDRKNERLEKKRARKEKRKDFIDGVLGKGN